MEDTEVTDVTDSNAPGSFAGTELDIGEVGGGGRDLIGAIIRNQQTVTGVKSHVHGAGPA